MRKPFRILVFIACLPCLMTVIRGQVFFEGRLLNQQDSSRISFATIELLETGEHALSSEEGTFRFYVGQKLDSIRLKVSGLGFRAQVTISPDYRGIEEVWIAQPPAEIGEVLIEGMTARQVVAAAIAAIPDNYADYAHAAHGFYRQYHQVNGAYQNLIEAQAVMLMRPEKKRDLFNVQEAAAIVALRRSNLQYYFASKSYGLEMIGLFKNNPVYHLNNSSLHPTYQSMYRFSFDTITAEKYVIAFSCPSYTSDQHGISNYDDVNLQGEGREFGRITVERGSLAIISYERIARRNHDYSYALAHNFVLPNRDYRILFDRGHLIVDYGKANGKWFLKRMLYSFTNDYLSVRSNRIAYHFEENYEWHLDHVSHTIPTELADQFVLHPYLSHLPYAYIPEQWEDIPALFFAIGQEVYHNLEETAPLDQQFRSQQNPTGSTTKETD